MIFINKASVNAGKVLGTTTLPASSRNTALQAVRYNSNSNMYVNTTNAPVASDQYTQGARFDANGAMYVRPVETLGVPANIDYDGGLAFDGTTNALLVTTAPVARYAIGWPLDQRGFVCMDPNAAAGAAPGAFTFQISTTAEQVTFLWTASTNALSYEIYLDGVLESTVSAPTLTTIIPVSSLSPGNLTMFAVNASGSTPSISNPIPLT